MCPPEISPEAELGPGLTKGASHGKTTPPTEEIAVKRREAGTLLE